MGPSTFLLAAATAFTAFTSVSANPVADPVANPVANPVAAFTPQATADEVLVGCYSSLLSFSAGDSYKWQTSGHCKEQCIPKNKAVIAINGTDCWCSDTLPPKASKVDSSNCDTICPGFGTVKCMSLDNDPRSILIISGGSGMDYFSVWNDGLKTSLDNADGSNSVSPVSSSAAGSTPTSPSVVTVIGGTHCLFPPVIFLTTHRANDRRHSIKLSRCWEYSVIIWTKQGRYCCGRSCWCSRHCCAMWRRVSIPQSEETSGVGGGA
jgi:hypothetical protein